MTVLNRRRALLGLLAAPAIIRTAGLLMPVRPAPAEWRIYDWKIGDTITVGTVRGIPADNRDYIIVAMVTSTGALDFGWAPA